MDTKEIPVVTALEIDGVVFPPVVVNPPGSFKSLFLGGAGVRNLEIQGKVIKFTSIGVYMEATALKSLSAKWKEKTEEELAESLEFFRDIVSEPFEKFIRVTMILPLTGQQYSEKVAEGCVAYWKAAGIYTDKEAEAVEKFKAAFNGEDFPPGSSILFTQSSSGYLTVAFSKDDTLPESGKAVIENERMSAVLETIIGKNAVSPAVKRSLATRVGELFKVTAAASPQNGHLAPVALSENGESAATVEHGGD
ncbi:chalcone-flavanone isomerase family protein [Wolffia australiana]